MLSAQGRATIEAKSLTREQKMPSSAHILIQDISNTSLYRMLKFFIKQNLSIMFVYKQILKAKLNHGWTSPKLNKVNHHISIIYSEER